MLTNFVALTAGLATTASAFSCTGYYFSFFNRNGEAVAYDRLDPILQPGTTSPHMHSFDGANVVSASTSYADMQGASCTTARIKTDKSLYWRPTLYWNGNGTGFHRVPQQANKIYYKYGDNGQWANVTEFPEGFQMIAGSVNKRADGDNPAAVRWGCHNPDGRGGDIFTNGFPKGFGSCKDGFAAEVAFPSCWNGQPMDPKNPNAHVAYSTNGGVGLDNCPTTHRFARFPTIFIEFWYDISSFDGSYGANDNPWMLGNGDPTGFSFHADFLNGWAKGVLGKATAQNGGCDCGCGCGQVEMEQCFGAANVNKNEDPAFAQCGSTDFSGEKAPVLQKLPGCNPVQAGPASATLASGPGCDATAVAASDDTPTSVASVATSSAAVSSAPASITLSLAGKGNAPSVPSAPAGNELPALSLVATPAPSTPTAGADDDCKSPVYVSVTNTVYVTVGSNTTSGSTITETKTATVTVPAARAVRYRKH